MEVPDAQALLAGLADPGSRVSASRGLAQALGAKHLLAWVRDIELEVLVPAPGFPQTLPGGPAWTAFLRECAHPGVHAGEVCFPEPHVHVPAEALTLGDGTVFMLVGGAPRIARLDATVLPVLAALLRAEHSLTAAEARSAAAQLSARHASALMAAVDSARGEAEAARQVAEQAVRAKDEFLAMLGHELRNPLSPMITALQLLKLRGVLGGDELGVIERQAAHLVRLVDDLLDVSKITRGKIELHREHAELRPLVMAAVEMASPLLERRGHRLEIRVPEAGLPLNVDVLRIKQVLANLLTNAAKYTGDGGVITVTGVREGDEVVARVRDNGIGIGADLLPRVFDLFVQGARGSDRAEGGLGIGLTLVRNLVRMHAGSALAHSEGPGRGSEFEVRLPAAQPGVFAPAQGVRRPLAQRADGERGRRVLLVDDNIDAVQMLVAALTEMGHDVTVAHDGLAALSAAERVAPEVAVLDIGLPVMDGYELARRLRERPNPPRLVALTGYGLAQDRQQSIEAGFEAHLTKPADIAQILEAIDTLGPAREQAGSPTSAG